MSGKYQGLKQYEEIHNPYDFDTKLFEDLNKRKINPIFVQTVDLRVAGSLQLLRPGFHFVIYGHDGGAVKAVNTTILVQAYINQELKTPDSPFPAKHARGFSGPFTAIYFEWLAQTNAFADILIFSNPARPWIDGAAAT